MMLVEWLKLQLHVGDLRRSVGLGKELSLGH